MSYEFISGLFQYTLSKHTRKTICLLSIPCLCNANFLRDFYPFPLFGSQTIEYYMVVMLFSRLQDKYCWPQKLNLFVLWSHANLTYIVL